MDMTPQQRDAAMELLATGLSGQGLVTAQAIMRLEEILAEIERSAGRSGWQRRHPELYWFRVLGSPGDTQPWAWKVGGHHLAVHMTVLGAEIAGTPQFFGANPARVPDGHADAGLRTLPEEEDLGRALVTALTPAQRDIAVAAAVAPNDILTRHDPVADVGRIASGLPGGDMDDEHRDLLERLVRRYLERVIPDVAGAAWSEIEAAGLERVSFRWAGSMMPGPGNGHY